MGRAGIVLGLEVSRLARNSSDWHRLLEICGERQRIGNRHAIHAAPPIPCAAGSRALDQNLTHRARGDADKVTLVVPGRSGLGEA